jgi:hypothetical protein
MIPRFSLLIEAMKRGLIDGADRRRLLGPLGKLGPLVGLLWHYLGHTRRRLAALHARYAAGRLAPAPRRRTTSPPATGRPRSERGPPSIPRGPVFPQYGLGCFVTELRELVEHPEMRALLAASPRAGRLLRPLWRKLTADPLPEVLCLPPKPPRAEHPRLARLAAARAAPAARPGSLRPASQRPASPRHVPLWPDPSPAAKPPPPLPAWPPPFWPD